MIISTMVDLLLGMILGMIVSPFMMKIIKSILQKRRVNRLLREAADHQEQKEISNNEDQRYKIL
jgi:Tfp pilus assembly protein PilW